MRGRHHPMIVSAAKLCSFGGDGGQTRLSSHPAPKDLHPALSGPCWRGVARA